MGILSRNVIYYGTDEPLPERVCLRAGPLSTILEAGDLRYIRLGNTEIVRRIYIALRDHNWDTIVPRINDLKIERGDRSFRVTYTAAHRRGNIDFVWRGAITGDEHGQIRFTMDGAARSTFLRNRLGFCVLLPAGEYAGSPFTAVKPDGSAERGQLPELIAPHQPVTELRAFRSEVISGVEAELQFEGDLFEMEDQRNWTDASFKIYCTPLHLRYPVEIKAGTKIAQAVTLSLRGYTGPAHIESEQTEFRELTVTLGQAPMRPLPTIGLGTASHGQPLAAREIERLRALHLAHLRVDLELFRPGWDSSLQRAAADARALGVPLEVALILSDAAVDELKALATALAETQPAVARWLVFHCAERSTTRPWIELARAQLTRYDRRAKFGAGTNHFFAELNRERPPLDLLDFVCYSMNPQVHAFDNTSLVENLEAQRWTVESARQFVGELPLVVSPVTLKMRLNPNATIPQSQFTVVAGELPPSVDPRQMSLFGAGWTVGSLKYLAESGAASLTYYETTGWRGVMEVESGSAEPGRFRSIPGGVFPVYHVFADVGEFAGSAVVPTRSSHPLVVDSLALQKADRTRALVANLSTEPRSVRIIGLARRVRLRQLDETNAEDAMLSPESFRALDGDPVETKNGALVIMLQPYAIARIDSTF